MPPTLTDHVSTIEGTQVRGSAIGTRKSWASPSAPVAVAAGVLTPVLLIEIPDELSVNIDLAIDAGSADGIEEIEIARSNTGAAWDTVFSTTLDPDNPPLNPGAIAQVADIVGWNAKYLRVQVRSKTGGGGSIVTCTALTSIFSSGRFSYVNLLDDGLAYHELLAERQQHIYSEGSVFSAAVPSTPAYTSEIIAASGVRTFDIEAGIKITGRTTLATLTITPEIYFGGEWRSLQTSSFGAGVQTITPAFSWQVPGITGDFNISVGIAKVVAEKVRFAVSGDVADGTLDLHAILKVPY